MITTLEKIREHSPCSQGWANLLKHLGKSGADSEPLDIVTILDSNGLDDALWCLRAVSGHDREIRLYAVWCARQVQQFMTDPRSIAAIDVAERFANGETGQDELTAARDAAWDAKGDAAGASAWGTSWGFAWDAAAAASRDARWDASRGSKGKAEQEAARTEAGAAQEKELRAVCARIAEQEAA